MTRLIGIGMALAVAAVVTGLAVAFSGMPSGGSDERSVAASVAQTESLGRWSDQVCALRTREFTDRLGLVDAALDAMPALEAANDRLNGQIVRQDIIEHNLERLGVDSLLLAANCDGGWDLHAEFEATVAASYARHSWVKADGTMQPIAVADRCAGALATTLPDVAVAAGDVDHGLRLMRDSAYGGLRDEVDTIWSEAVEPSITQQERLINGLQGECSGADQILHPELFVHVRTIRIDATAERDRLLDLAGKQNLLLSQLR